MNKNNLTQTEKYIWRYLVDNSESVVKMTITELSQKSNVSSATITRTLQKQGYDGFSEFKHVLSFKNKENLEILYHHDLNANSKQAILKNYQEVIKTLNMIEPTTLNSVVKQIFKSKRVIIFACGFSQFIAQEMLVKFQLIGKYSEFHSDPNIIKKMCERLKSEDFVIFVSLNGETIALVEAAKKLLKRNVQTLLITASKSSSLYNLSTFQLSGFKTNLTYFPDFEVNSRLPLAIIARILLDTYAAHLS